MLKIQNIEKIKGHEFKTKTLAAEWVVGLFQDGPTEYQFGVFQMENGVGNLRKGIVFTLGKRKINRGYPITNNKTKYVGLVTPENLTLKNFQLELAIQTAMAIHTN